MSRVQVPHASFSLGASQDEEPLAKFMIQTVHVIII